MAEKFCVLLIFLMPVMGFAQDSLSFPSPLPEPRIFAEGIISTGDHESHPAISPDGRELFFIKMAPDFSKWTIYVSHFVDGKWTEPKIASFSGQYWDADPCFTKDGKILYFISNRPVKPGDPMKADFDIWKIERGKNGWSEPARMEPPINSETSEYYPTVADNGTMYFGSRRKGGIGATDIFRSRLQNGKYQTAENLGKAVNTSGNEFEPFIAPDESFLIFMATPTEYLEDTDLYVSFHQQGKWSKAVKLPEPFSSGGTEFSPKVSPDGKYFFFSSTRNKESGKFLKPESTSEMIQRIRKAGNGLLDIYQVDFSALQDVLNTTKTQKHQESQN
jgi:Tol biopolymer transport system component